MVKCFLHALEFSQSNCMKVFILNVFRALFGHGIGESLVMACLGHAVGLKSRWKSN